MISSSVIVGSTLWYFKQYSNLDSSVWDCYASSSKGNDLPSFVTLPGYKDITYTFKNICAHGMIVSVWLILSAIGSLILIKVKVGEKIHKGL